MCCAEFEIIRENINTKDQDNRFTWFTNKLATSTGREGAVLLWRGKKQNYRIGFAIASIYIYIVLSYALTGLGPSFLFVAGPIQGIQHNPLKQVKTS